MKVLVDTSAVVAIANKTDQYHSIALLVLEKSRVEKVQCYYGKVKDRYSICL